MHSFQARLEIIGVNPFVFVPEEILENIFQKANKSSGPIPICGRINDLIYKQTLVKYAGHWRLYINTSMLKNSPQRIGESVQISVAFDPESREIKPPDLFIQALTTNPEANAVFDRLPAYRKKEIVRYLSRLKSEEILAKNVVRAINFLLGKERFVGRDSP